MEVDCHIKGQVRLSNGEVFDIHYRWMREEEDAQGKEIKEDVRILKEYFDRYCKGKEITKVEVGYTDRDDEAYLLLYVNDDHCLEVPIGFEADLMNTLI